jgi:hypothetical protein
MKHRKWGGRVLTSEQTAFALAPFVRKLSSNKMSSLRYP